MATWPRRFLLARALDLTFCSSYQQISSFCIHGTENGFIYVEEKFRRHIYFLRFRFFSRIFDLGGSIFTPFSMNGYSNSKVREMRFSDHIFVLVTKSLRFQFFTPLSGCSCSSCFGFFLFLFFSLHTSIMVSRIKTHVKLRVWSLRRVFNRCVGSIRRRSCGRPTVLEDLCIATAYAVTTSYTLASWA